MWAHQDEVIYIDSYDERPILGCAAIDTGICLTAVKTMLEEELVQLEEPAPRGLFQSIDGSVKSADHVCVIAEAWGLIPVDLLLYFPMQESSLYIHLMNDIAMCIGVAEENPDGETTLEALQGLHPGCGCSLVGFSLLGAVLVLLL